MNIVNYINFQVEEEQKNNELLTVKKGGFSNAVPRFDGNQGREGEPAAGEQAAGF
ncbi:MAG: hypothetical protein ACLVLP_05270 [Phascolarctobacterium faecium]|uniref:hypothetical protein n=1 Tax=Phascolarctobacterium faecium TaxID=33025 RepID=UPI00399A9734